MKHPSIRRVDMIYGVADVLIAEGFAEVTIVSGKRETRITCDPDTDELRFKKGAIRKIRGRDIMLRGKYKVQWLWMFKNQNGYFDGFRIQLSSDHGWRTLEFVTVCSTVDVFEPRKRLPKIDYFAV